MMVNHRTVLELCFPSRCAGCGRYAGMPVCPECNSSLPFIRGASCGLCGKPTLYEVHGCLECRGRLKHLDATVAMATYQEPLRAIIHKFKYDNGRRLAPLLGSMAAVRLAAALDRGDPLVSHVPMHRRKRRDRGYDHADLLARGVARALGLKAVSLLERARPTAAQSSLSREERHANVRGAFLFVGDELGGGDVVLVDDVLTTGSTLSECAAALKGGGAGRVTACVLARDVIDGPGRPPPPAAPGRKSPRINGSADFAG